MGTYGTQKMNLQHGKQIGKFNYLVGFGQESATGFSSASDIIGNKNFDKDGSI